MPRLEDRLLESLWEELEWQAEQSGCYVDRSTGVIEGRFELAAIVSELVERYQLVANI